MIRQFERYAAKRVGARVAVVTLAVVCIASCKEEILLPSALGGFDVEIAVEGASGGDGSAAAPYDIPQNDITIRYSASAHDLRGQPFPYKGTASLKLSPGVIVSADPPNPVFWESQAQGSLTARKLFGRVALWLEDFQIEDSVLVEGGSQPIQLVRREGSFAAGISQVVHFKRPRLYNIQYAPWLQQDSNIDDSALPGVFADIDCRAGDPAGPYQDGHGQLVVTGVFNEGFFVTDLAGPAGYNHLYAYNYSYPEGLEVGYRLDRLVGSTQDFSGCTQISFPSWRTAADENLDPEPFRVKDLDAVVPPVLLGSAACLVGSTASNRHLCGHSKQNWTMEALESARVRLENLKAPDLFVNCDFNGDGSVVADWQDASHPEAICSVNCLKHDGAVNFAVKEIIGTAAALAEVIVTSSVVCPWEADIPGIRPHCKQVRITAGHICSELTTLRQYGQWVVAMDGGTGPLINLVTDESLVNYEPTAAANLGRSIPFLQGNLQQVRAARPRWLVMVGRLPQDAPEEMRR